MIALNKNTKHGLRIWKQDGRAVGKGMFSTAAFGSNDNDVSSV